MMFIATIVYIMGVNPTAQASALQFTDIYLLCNQLYTPAATDSTDQYLYHYCVVDPQEVGVVFSLPFPLSEVLTLGCLIDSLGNV